MLGAQKGPVNVNYVTLLWTAWAVHYWVMAYESCDFSLVVRMGYGNSERL